MQALAEKGQLGTLTVDQLKPYLRANGLKLTGRKADLIQSMTDHMSKAA